MRTFIFCLVFLMTPAKAAQDNLSTEFLESDGRIQLYLAYAEFKMGHHDLARSMWEAIQGAERAEALFNLAILHEQGLGVEADLGRALELYKEGAELGSRASAYQLGLLYLNRAEVQDQDRAIYWLSEAANSGDSDAANLLASLRDDETDPLIEINNLLAAGERDKALSRLEGIAKQSEPPAAALTLLAWHYEAGAGVEPDLEYAADLFERAAELGDSKAQYALSVMYRTGKGRAQREALADLWLERSQRE